MVEHKSLFGLDPNLSHVALTEIYIWSWEYRHQMDTLLKQAMCFYEEQERYKMQATPDATPKCLMIHKYVTD